MYMNSLPKLIDAVKVNSKHSKIGTGIMIEEIYKHTSTFHKLLVVGNHAPPTSLKKVPMLFSKYHL